MAHTVAFRLQKSASQFAAGDSTGFGIRGGVQYQAPKSNDKQYTNYEAAIFAKTPAQIDFYASKLVEGAMVVVSCEKLYIRENTGQDGRVHQVLNMINARLEAVAETSGNKPVPQQQAQPRAAAPQTPPAGFNDWDDDIAF